MKFMKWMSVLFICVFVFSAQEAFAGSCSSNGTGVNWSEAANWTGSCVGAGGGFLVLAMMSLLLPDFQLRLI
jgi:hypothetical protein